MRGAFRCARPSRPWILLLALLVLPFEALLHAATGIAANNEPTVSTKRGPCDPGSGRPPSGTSSGIAEVSAEESDLDGKDDITAPTLLTAPLNVELEGHRVPAGACRVASGTAKRAGLVAARGPPLDVIDPR